jgi:rhodanese-related sulfurtransferase
LDRSGRAVYSPQGRADTPAHRAMTAPAPTPAFPHAPPILVTPRRLFASLRERCELALLDVREARAYVGAHLALARMTPLSSLELDVTAMVPRPATPVVLVDADGAPDGPARRARTLLRRLGYLDVGVLDGGLAGWRAAGLPVIDGYGSLVKAFGDRVRRHHATPTLAGADLRARQAAGAATTLIDVRPADEYAYLTLPGGGNHAGTELALRAWPDAAPEAVVPPATPWVVHCFSRTRGIIGATTLRVLGHPDVRFLEDGVMRWMLDSGPTVEDAPPAIELPTAPAHELRRRADDLVDRHDLPRATPGDLARFHAETDRTLFVFDLRPGATDGESGDIVRAVAGGQLLMHFENLVGTRHARIVLIDAPHRLRAAVTSFWLTQLDQAEVFILEGDPPPLPRRDPAPGRGPEAAEGEAIAPARLAALLRDGADDVRIVDVGPSADYERQHLPGAHFLLPFTWTPLDALQRPGRRIVFTSPDGRAARLAARDACERRPGSDAGWLTGGTRAWRDAGLPTESDWAPHQRLTPFEDDWGSVMRVPASRRERAWTDYLAWERALADRMARDDTVRFRLFDVAPSDPATATAAGAGPS